MRQRGVAVITALLLTTLAITIVASLFWQQQVQVRSIENQRLQLQKQWILRGALDWASLILRADYNSSGDVDHLGEPWAAPLAETQLDQYVENGRADGEASQATLSGNIIDAQSRFNLRNLVAIDGKPEPREVAVYQQLLSSLRLSPSLAEPTALAIAEGLPPPPMASGAPPPATPPATGGKRPLRFVFLEDLLRVPGYTPAMIEKLRPYALFLPLPTRINVNTASLEVLAARF
ncbi:MAG: type II secretion system minor pseudopilin GspK, partial [Proteobacteria bacterium]|nr:type II secretion system minor pseudopilin GspK [Pseudomonadota bacterium]